MHLPHRLKAVGLAAALAVLSTTCSAADAKFYGWYPCSQWSLAEEVPLDNSTTPDIPDAECAVFKAPLCYDGVCTDKTNQQVDIFVKRYQKGDGAGKPNVIFMQGGPGASSAAMEDGMTSLYALLEENVNVYTMDHRGTGRSTLLDCVAAQAQTSGSPGGTGISPSEVANCAAELQSRYGSNLASFSVTSAASDLKNFITNYLKGTTYVYGVSYGTLLVERLMHLDTPNVGGYVLDGIATTSGASLSDGLYMSKWDLNMDAVGKLFMDRCADNSDECGKYFSASSLPSTLRTLISKFDSSYSFQPCSDFLIEEFKDLFQIQSLDTAGPIMRQFFGMLIKSMTMRKLIPVITYRVNRCSLEDQKVLSHFFDVYKQAYSTPSEEDQLSSSLLYGLIVYSELWESPPPSQTTIDTRFANTLIASYGASVKSYCAFTKDTSSVCSFSTANDYKAGAIAYKKDKYYNVAASPPKDVSVLLMSGKLDPQTPDQYAQTLLQALDTTNKAIVQFDYATHATLWTTPMASAKAPTCGMQILASYVKNSGDLSKLDKSCIDKMPKFSFAMSKNAMAKWLNVTDAFDGDKLEGLAVYETDVSGDSSSSTSSSSSSTKSKYQAVFIAAAVAFGVALVVAIVFAIKWMRAKKANESSIKEVNVYTENTV